MEPEEESEEAQAESTPRDISAQPPVPPPSEDAPVAEEPTDAVEPEEESEEAQAESTPRDISAQPPVPPPSEDAPVAEEPTDAVEPEEESEEAQAESPVPTPTRGYRSRPAPLPSPVPLGADHPNIRVLNRALDTYRDEMASFMVEEFARHEVAAAGAISRALDRSLRREYRERLADVARPRDAIRIMYVPSVVRYWWSRYFADHFDGDRGVLSLLEQIAEASERARSAGDDLPADDVARDIGLVSDLFERLGQPDLAAEMNDLRSQLREGPSTQDRPEREQAPAGPRAATPQPEPARGVAERAEAAGSALPQAAPELPDAASLQPAAITPKRIGVSVGVITFLGVVANLAGLPWGKFFRVVALAESSISFVVILYEWRVLGIPVLVVVLLALMLAVWLGVWTAYRLGWLRRGSTVAPWVARGIGQALRSAAAVGGAAGSWASSAALAAVASARRGALAAARAAGNRARRVASTAARAARDSAWLRGITSLAPRVSRSLGRVLATGLPAAREAGSSAFSAALAAGRSARNSGWTPRFALAVASVMVVAVVAWLIVSPGGNGASEDPAERAAILSATPSAPEGPTAASAPATDATVAPGATRPAASPAATEDPSLSELSPSLDALLGRLESAGCAQGGVKRGPAGDEVTCTIRGTLSTTELSDAIGDDFTSDFTLYLVVLVDGEQYQYTVGTSFQKHLPRELSNGEVVTVYLVEKPTQTATAAATQTATGAPSQTATAAPSPPATATPTDESEATHYVVTKEEGVLGVGVRVRNTCRDDTESNIASKKGEGIGEDSKVFVLGGGGGDCDGWVWVREASDQKRESWVRVEYLTALALKDPPPTPRTWYFGKGRTAGEVIVASIGGHECSRATAMKKEMNENGEIVVSIQWGLYVNSLCPEAMVGSCVEFTVVGTDDKRFKNLQWSHTPIGVTLGTSKKGCS